MQFTDIVTDVEGLVLIMLFFIYVGMRNRKK